MKRVLTAITYFTFVIACIAVMMVFITSKTYLQLGVAIVLYPVVVFLGYKAFPRHRDSLTPAVAYSPAQGTLPAQNVDSQDGASGVTVGSKLGTVDVADIDRRVFLKLVGATGLSFFLISLFSRRTADTLLYNKLNTGKESVNPVTDQVNTASQKQGPSGYTITEIDDNLIAYYGFTNTTGGWYIMREDSLSGSFRYVKGDSDFPSNWKDREDLKYAYYNDVFGE